MHDMLLIQHYLLLNFKCFNFINCQQSEENGWILYQSLFAWQRLVVLHEEDLEVSPTGKILNVPTLARGN